VEEFLRAGLVLWDAVFKWAPRPHGHKVLIFYSLNVETGPRSLWLDALAVFFGARPEGQFRTGSDDQLEELNDANLKPYQLVVWLNEFPHNQAEREAFERYMTGGRVAWLSRVRYNDKVTKWPWFMTFIGGGVVCANSWPPLPAKPDVTIRRVGHADFRRRLSRLPTSGIGGNPALVR